MKQRLFQVTLVVNDYDEAIAFYTQRLNFTLVEDTPLTTTKRWVRIAPPGDLGFCLLLAKAADEKQSASVGNQTGGRVFLFLMTDDLMRDETMFTQRAVTIVRAPRLESYGKVMVIADLYGNLIDIIEPASAKEE